MVSIIRLIYFIPQTATWTTFSTPIPETSHKLDLVLDPKILRKD